MWVRSQNRELIANVEAFRTNSYYDLQKHFIEGGIDNFYLLGEYSTSYQCIDILDEIESVINNGCPFVYKMPEDEGEAYAEDIFENATKKRKEVEGE